jgi:hypothetical protein
MALSMELNLVLIRTGKNDEVAAYVLQLLRQHSTIAVCNALLQAVELETIEPFVFAIFLSATKSADCLVACLRQPYSVFVRRQAIKHYGRAWATPDRWHDAWIAIGGTQGLLDTLKTFSVDEVKQLFASVGSCNRGLDKPKEREAAIEELLKAMSPGLFPEAVFKNTDKRPLEHYAIPLVPACSTDFIGGLLAQGSGNHLYADCSKIRLTKTHGSLLRDYAVRTTFNNTAKRFPDDVGIYLREFCFREPSVSAEERKFSASMAFSEKLLEMRLDNPDIAWPSQLPETTIYFSLLHRCTYKEVGKGRQHEIYDLGLRLLERKPHLKNGFIGREQLLWSRLTEYWGRNPGDWEDLIIRGLRLGLGGSDRSIGDAFVKFASRSKIKEERAWPLLRLLCLHVPKDGVDIDDSDDLKALAKQKWTIQVFHKLPSEKAIRLLKGLIRVNQSFNFLQAASNNTILSMQALYDQRNVNALLFLTQLQARSPDGKQQAEAQQRARDAVTDLKNKSASSREQPERAQYAKAAGFFAIASGSLGLFGEHVAWLQRFLRDPLTVKIIFNRDAIASHDASELLSGIPQPLLENVELSAISASVAKANEILLKFHAHKQVAKREPSFQASDWKAVSSLLSAAVKTRIARANKLQMRLNAAPGQLYSAIWSQTFAMFSQVGTESMKEVCTLLSLFENMQIRRKCIRTLPNISLVGTFLWYSF